MSDSPVLLLHIASGTLGVLSGFVAAFLRKGSRRHAVAGNVFVVAMLSLSLTGVYLAILKWQVGNILGGALTFYMVATSWMTAHNRDGRTGGFGWGALLLALGVASVTLTYGFEAAMSPSGLKNGDAAGQYFFLGSVALLAATGDVRMLVRGGVSGAQRIARHLWRMCFALFIAAASVFLARAHLFPTVLRKTGVLFLLSFLPLMLMMFWLIRVRFTNAYKRIAPPIRTHDDRGEVGARRPPRVTSWNQYGYFTEIGQRNEAGGFYFEFRQPRDCEHRYFVE